MRTALFALAFAIAAPARADAALQQILAESAGAPLPAIERTTRAELRAHPEKEPALVVDRFVPAGTSGRWTLVSVDGRKPTAKEAEAHRKGNAAIVPGFHRLHKVLGGPPTRRTEADGRTIFLWSSLPEGAVVTPGGDISGKLSAEATLEQVGGKPLISEVRVFAAKPFKIRGIATMNSFNVVSLYRPGNGGLPFLTSQTSASDVDAPFGLGGKRRSQISFKPL
ncbi:MAG: hypothetical protein ACRC1J_08445 [Sandaracinobacteroides sp.]